MTRNGLFRVTSRWFSCSVQTSRLLSWFIFLFLFGPTCTLFDLSIASRLRHHLLRLLRLHIAWRLVRHGYHWVPTDEAHDHPRQVGLAYQKICRPDSGPNRPSLWPTQPPEDLTEDSPGDLIRSGRVTWCARQGRRRRLNVVNQSEDTGLCCNFP
jgi:hypothetical protein